MATSTPASPLRRPSSASLRPPGTKPKLSRRWSFDNINSKEGYVKDLRQQHQAQQVGQRDEAYPFMMTEKRIGRVGSLKINLESPRRPLSCSPPPGILMHACKRSRTMSLDEEANEAAAASLVRSSRPKRSSVPTFRFRKGSSSTELATSIVPEDFEFHMEEKASPIQPSNVEVDELFRKRSSSLPRILPPICDQEENDDDIFEQPNLSPSAYTKNSGKQMDQTSNLIVREMQKFVCKNALDVSQVLPLPIPANTRQENRLSSGSSIQNPVTLDAQHSQILMQNLAKIHAIGYAISQKNPPLFQEISTSLEKSNHLLKRKLELLNNRPALIQILEASTPLINIDNYDQIIDTVKTQATELYSQHLCPLFPVITHGHLKNLTFKYSQTSEVSGVKFSSLRHSLVASPLLDIYAAIFLSHQKEVEVQLKTYLGAMQSYASNLKVSLVLNFDQVMSQFKKYELTGMILTSLMNAQKAEKLELGRSCSLGGHDMLMRNLPERQKPLLENLGNDMGKLAIEKKTNPFSHQEDLEEESN